MISAHTPAFIENRGQVADVDGKPRPDILYSIQGRGASLYFLKDRISYVFARIETNSEKRAEVLSANQGDEHHREENPYHISELYRMDMELVGSNPYPVVEATGPLTGYTNYYLGHCPDGILNVRSYNCLTYRDIYPKIDMVMRMQEGGIKCDFVVRPGGRVSDIRLRYVGDDNVKLGRNGGVKAVTALGMVEESAPYSYQTIGGAQQEVSSRYMLAGDVIGQIDVVRFDVGEYDERQTLVIDPYRKWATYYGGGNTDGLNGSDPSEVDRAGDILFTGWTLSNPFPTTTGETQYSQKYGGGNIFGDAFVAKFSITGNRLWATYYGGTGNEMAHAISSDTSRNIFITGHVEGGGLPVSLGAYQTSPSGSRDGFVVKFDSDGTRLWGTYFGGSDYDDGYGLGVDPRGNVAVVLTTASAGLESVGMTSKPGGTTYDALLVQFDSTGQRLWANYLGGTESEYAYAATIDSNNDIAITGWTNSSNFPTTVKAAQSVRGGSYDMFVAKFTQHGMLLWSTYYGGSGTEGEDPSVIGYAAITADLDRNIVIAGHTTGTLPVTPGSYQATFGGGERDGFIVKFNASGVRKWSTYIGGSDRDIATSITATSTGDVIVAGLTKSIDFPTTSDGDQPTNAGAIDAFITRLDSSGRLRWSTYYGGSSDDQGYGVAVSPFGSTLLAGGTKSIDFPTRFPFQSSNAGVEDVFVVLFCNTAPTVIGASGPLTFQDGDSVVLSIRPANSAVLWSDSSTTDSIVVKQGGKYWVRVVSGDGCLAYSDTLSVIVKSSSEVTMPEVALWPSAQNLESEPRQVLYEMVQQGPVQMYITDVTGRRVTTLVDEIVTSGHHRMMLNTEGLASGKYFLILQTSTHRIVRQLIVNR
jgi:hypothetical protein